MSLPECIKNAQIELIIDIPPILIFCGVKARPSLHPLKIFWENFPKNFQAASPCSFIVLTTLRYMVAVF